MTTQGKPTPGPWEVRDDHPTRACLKITRAGSRLVANEVAVVYLTDPVATYEANAALIVRAVNNHAALVEALEGCISVIEDRLDVNLLDVGETIDEARAALSAYEQATQARKEGA